MSEPFVMVPKTLLRAPSVSPTAKLLLALLADYRNRENYRNRDTEQCNPAIDTLAEELAVSARTIDRSITELSRLGFIRITWRQRTSHYEVASKTRWPEILKRQIGVSEPESCNAKLASQSRQIGVSDGSVSLLTKRKKKEEEPPIPPGICAPDGARVDVGPALPLVEVGPALPKPPRSADGFRPEERFPEFWSAYSCWREVAKKRAEKAFRRTVKSQECFEQVMAAIQLQTPMMMARPVDKRPYASTWLDEEGWTDPPEAPARKSPSKSSTVDELAQSIAAIRRLK